MIGTRIIEKPLDELIAAPYNPRRIGKAAREGLEKSIGRFGMVQPIVWNERTGHVVGGHQRLAVLRKNGVASTQVVAVDLDSLEEKILNITLNNPNIAGEFTPAIDGLLKEIQASEDAAFENLCLEDLKTPDFEEVKNVEGEDDIPEAPAEPICKPGDLWRLGDHVLFCGDSNIISEQITGGKIIDLLLYDPPFEKYIKPSIHADTVLAFTNGQYAGRLLELLGAPRWLFSWNGVTKWYIGEHNPLLGAKYCFWYGKDNYRNKSFYGSPGEETDVSNTRGEYHYVPNPKGKRLSDCFVFQITQIEHSYGKPVDWIRMLIANCNPGGHTIFDGFAGSGTSIIAAEQLSRNCYAVEINPTKCDVIIKRWETFTGKTAVLSSPVEMEASIVGA